jgi:alkylation response protein AidB-like acyl-CoA dehydrogenase
VRFAVSEEAAVLRDAAREVLADSRDWRKLASVGVIGTMVPGDRGGLGLDENALVPVLEEIGYSGLPVPAVETIAVAAPLLPGSLLESVLTGDLHVAAEMTGGELVPFGQYARLIVLRDGEALRVYERGELTLEPCASVDRSRRVARVVRRSGGILLTDDPVAVEAAWRRGVLGTAAVLTGLARRMLDMTVHYVKRREQFGVPIGSFQAVKHALADALIAIEFARPMVLAAGWAQAAGAADAAALNPAALASAAKVRATDAARLVARTAIQCHGAMGYTTEYDLHVFAKRVWALAPSWGSPEFHRARIANLLGIAGLAEEAMPL